MPIALFVIVGFAAIALMSMVLHEYAHGYVAYLSGDYTAEAMGRLSLNPIRHIDPVMTIIVPIALLWMTNGRFVFGGAKPVPVNPYNFRHRRRDSRLVSAAGVTTNLLIALLLGLVLQATLAAGLFQVDPVPPYGKTSAGAIVLGMGILFNVMLFAFNLAPIPPLDGSRILRSFLPAHLEAVMDRMDRFGIFILILLLNVFPAFFIVIRLVIGFVWAYVLRLRLDYLDAIYGGFQAAISNLL